MSADGKSAYHLSCNFNSQESLVLVNMNFQVKRDGKNQTTYLAYHLSLLYISFSKTFAAVFHIDMDQDSLNDSWEHFPVKVTL